MVVSCEISDVSIFGTSNECRDINPRIKSMKAIALKLREDNQYNCSTICKKMTIFK